MIKFWRKGASIWEHLADIAFVVGFLVFASAFIPEFKIRNLCLSTVFSNMAPAFWFVAQSKNNSRRPTLLALLICVGVFFLSVLAVYYENTGFGLIALGLLVVCFVAQSRGYFLMRAEIDPDHFLFKHRERDWYRSLLEAGAISYETCEAALKAIKAVQDFCMEEGNFEPQLPVSCLKTVAGSKDLAVMMGWTDSQNTVGIGVYDPKGEVRYFGDSLTPIEKDEFLERLSYLSSYVLSEAAYSSLEEDEEDGEAVY